VYVAKRPGVDEFLTEMAKHYEIVVYTASLNKYADPLLDLLDPNRVIRTRLFRESCVYYEGNYVKDMSLLDRNLTQAIIVDNSPSSYIFHPENAIDCSSFIDDPRDRELDQIGKFLVGIKDIEDVRGTSNLWREWPRIELPLSSNMMKEEEDLDEPEPSQTVVVSGSKQRRQSRNQSR
jgi:RNA polymerase II subunit A small phosphatase-like protein